jgi:hypothetical protein
MWHHHTWREMTVVWSMTSFSLGAVHCRHLVWDWWIRCCLRLALCSRSRAQREAPPPPRVLSVVTPPLKKLIRQFCLEVKQNNSSPQTHESNSFVKESSVHCPVGIRCSSHHRRTKIKYRKSVVKVIHDMLTKKWVFVKMNKQPSATPPPPPPPPPCLSNLPPPVEHGSSKARVKFKLSLIPFQPLWVTLQQWSNGCTWREHSEFLLIKEEWPGSVGKEVDCFEEGLAVTRRHWDAFFLGFGDASLGVVLGCCCRCFVLVSFLSLSMVMSMARAW